MGPIWFDFQDDGKKASPIEAIAIALAFWQMTGTHAKFVGKSRGTAFASPNDDLIPDYAKARL